MTCSFAGRSRLQISRGSIYEPLTPLSSLCAGRRDGIQYSEFNRWAGTLSHLLHLEGLAPEEPTDLDGGAHLRASWEIISPEDGAVVARGTTDYQVDGWTVGDYGGLVDRLDAGLWELARDLVSALDGP